MITNVNFPSQLKNWTIIPNHRRTSTPSKKVFIISYASLFLVSPLLSMLVVWMSLGPKNPDYEENWEKGTQWKKEKMERRKRMLSFSKLPSRRLREVKDKTLLHRHVKVVNINVHKLYGASSQSKFRQSSHSMWTQFVHFFLLEPSPCIFMLSNTW